MRVMTLSRQLKLNQVITSLSVLRITRPDEIEKIGLSLLRSGQLNSVIIRQEGMSYKYLMVSSAFFCPGYRLGEYRVQDTLSQPCPGNSHHGNRLLKSIELLSLQQNIFKGLFLYHMTGKLSELETAILEERMEKLKRGRQDTGHPSAMSDQHHYLLWRGTPRQIKSDNRKACVDRWEYGRPVFNRKFLGISTHYHIVPRIITPGKPRNYENRIVKQTI